MAIVLETDNRSGVVWVRESRPATESAYEH